MVTKEDSEGQGVGRKIRSLGLTCICACVLSHVHGLQPTRILCPWNFPGKNTRVGCHFLLQGIFLTQGSNPHVLHQQVDSLPLSHLGSLQHTHNALYKQQGPVWHRELYAISCIAYNGKNLKNNICICITESLCRTTETNTTL